MSMLHDIMLDAALQIAISNGSRLDLCSSEPATYGGIASVTLAYKTSISYGSIANKAGGGREVEIAAITDGICTAGGVATHFAISNGTSTIYATGSLNANVNTANGAMFTLTAFKIGIPDPV